MWERSPSEPTSSPEPALVTRPEFRLGPSSPIARQQLAKAEQWIAAGTVPGEGTRWEEMARAALLDIRQQLSPLEVGGGPPAGAGEQWGYFWPRDGAFVLMALDRTGHHAEARSIVDFMARLPFDDEAGFDARYLLGGGRVEHDRRGPQSDGCGWVLWALASVSDASLPSAASKLRDQCVANLLELTAAGAELPPPSPDYWEVPVRRTSLGTVTPMLAGLRAVAHDPRTPARLAADAGAATDRLTRTVEAHFGPTFQRFGNEGGMDAAVAVLLPPFGPGGSAPSSRWEVYQREARRVSGGLAPGSAWKQDGTSWTPETALVAYTAAGSGRDQRAAEWLDWLDGSRTSWGSLPEKVTRSGKPGGPAPLLWTSSLVLLTLDELDKD
jgi:hypothetical protein